MAASNYPSSDIGAAFDDSSDTATSTTTSGYRILLIDDEPNVLKSLQRVFRLENYTVVCAASGQEALELLRKQSFHLMISDHLMPGMTGTQLVKYVKELRPETIRIMLTGHSDTSAVMTAIKEGLLYTFILKPWNDDDLRMAVALALEKYELTQKNKTLQLVNATKTKEIITLSKLAVTNRSQLAIMLNKKKLLSSEQVQELHQLQQQKKEPIIKLLLERDWVSEQAIRDILHKEMMIKEVSLAEFKIDASVAALFPRSFCEHQFIVPLRLDGNQLLLALADPLDVGLLDDLRFMTGLQIQPVMANMDSIKTKLTKIYNRAEGSFKSPEKLATSVDPNDGIEVEIEDEDIESLEDMMVELVRDTSEAPAIRLVNSVIFEAARLGASDIHIQPRATTVMLRYRIDGVMMDRIQIPHQLHQSFVSRLKVMAEMDISERRRPQDGRITVKMPNRVVDLRISTLPTINGEKVVLRILDRNAAIASLNGLGLSTSDLQKILNMVDKPQGLILTTGPTGSGKTTTLYALLQHNATPTKNYVTIEDPVEYYMDQAGQVLVKEKIGMTFPVILRAILRQDPDVILLGEIRDIETAEVAFHAAMTGHLVFSTLHTNSAVGTLSRLFNLGLKPYVVAAALEGIIAQRLVRKICTHCRAVDTPEPSLLKKMGTLFTQAGLTAYKGKGCERCNGSGYKGRVGLYEVLTINDSMRHLIGSGVTLMEISNLAQEMGTSSLIGDGRDKVNQGLTTVDELLRVLGPQ